MKRKGRRNIRRKRGRRVGEGEKIRAGLGKPEGRGGTQSGMRSRSRHLEKKVWCGSGKNSEEN
jgi:hypothetical protein